MADGDVTDPLDVAVLTPRLVRYVAGPEATIETVPFGRPQAAAMIADAASEVVFQTRGTFGISIEATHHDEAFMAADRWAFTAQPTEAQEIVVCTQAAISYLYRKLATALTSEEISDEGQTWRYQLSSTLQREWLAYLKAQRDAALGSLRASGVVVDTYISTVQTRDAAAAASVEAWVTTS